MGDELPNVFDFGTVARTTHVAHTYIISSAFILPRLPSRTSAFKRLRNTALVRLVKYSRQYNGWYDYTKGKVIDDGLFFYRDTFWVIITDEGRARWDQSADPIGLRRPA